MSGHGVGRSGGGAHATPVVLAAALLLAATRAAPVAGQTGVDPDTVRAGRFDTGKMWTFEYPPTRYFSDTYGFDATADWFRRARLSVLRIPGCSASFVSPNGLVATNHHCVRGAIPTVERAGEDLLADGFYAGTVAEERRIDGFYADQLIAIEDVTAEVFAALDRGTTDAERDRLRGEAVTAIQQRLRGAHAGGSWPVHVEITALYHGGRYSAYVFRRYTDVRLVAAAELQLGFFGGDADNFTYPRHALDFAFLRVYDEDGQPLRADAHFTWGRAGTRAGDVVFVIGNPGPTNRLNTVAQLEYLRDVTIPHTVAWLEHRLDALADYRASHAQQAEAMDISNLMFGLSNSLKANIGRREALGNAVVMAKRRDAERQLRDSIAARPQLRARYGNVIDSLAALQRSRRALAPAFGAFLQFGNPTYSSATLRRALAAHIWKEAVASGVPADSAERMRQRIAQIPSLPPELELRYLAGRLEQVRRSLGDEHPLTRTLLAGASPEDAARRLLDTSVFADPQKLTAALQDAGGVAQDPAARAIAAMLPAVRDYQAGMVRLNAAEAELAQQLGRARFDIFGTSIPPDATFSPRITDGVVTGYEYNGTLAPPHTTFYGMYDLYHAFGAGSEWDLPDRWLPPPPGLDLATPLNFVSTADTYGGNSGSPAVTRELALVGLNFDRNIEGLTRDFIYLPERGRNVMVDARAILEALDDVYDADRIVMELLTGRLFRTEAEADANRASGAGPEAGERARGEQTLDDAVDDGFPRRRPGVAEPDRVDRDDAGVGENGGGSRDAEHVEVIRTGRERPAGEVRDEDGDDQVVDESVRGVAADAHLGEQDQAAERPVADLLLFLGRAPACGFRSRGGERVVADVEPRFAHAGHHGVLAFGVLPVRAMPEGQHRPEHEAGDVHEHRREQDRQDQRKQRNHESLRCRSRFHGSARRITSVRFQSRTRRRGRAALRAYRTDEAKRSSIRVQPSAAASPSR
jgi:hypothetical protein